MSEKTEDWNLYLAGVNYNNSLDPPYYDTVNANIDFNKGRQWRNLEDDNLPKPVFNIIKRIISFMVASLTTSNIKLNFEPLLHSEIVDESDEQLKMAEMANAQVTNLLNKFKMEFKVKDALFDAAITGDGCAHFYFDISKQPYGGAFSEIKGDICMELVDGTNVMFGNANNPDPQVQPYIIVSGRDMVKNLIDEAKQYSENAGDPENIKSDENTQYQAGDSSSNIEVKADKNGKALYIIVYRKKKVKRPKKDPQGQPMVDQQGQPITEEVTTITASKSVEGAYIYKDIDTGLSLYPIAWLNWEKQKNQYHGHALCTEVIPNQVFINKMFAMIFYHLMLSAFPKAVYNQNFISQWSNEIGTAIPVNIGANENITNVAGYLRPADMSNQITKVIDMAMQYTKETLGVTDAALGNVNPTNTSAIIAVTKSSSVPLKNTKSNLYEWIESIGSILFDMMGTYYGLRPVKVERNGQKVVEQFNFSVFKNMWIDVSADVGESSYWSEISAQATLDNLLRDGHLEFIDYLKRVSDDAIPQKQELINELEQKAQQLQPPNPADIIKHLPPDQQKAFMSASPQVQQQMIQQAMQAQQTHQPMS